MRTHFSEVRRILRPGGVIGYAVANSTRGGKQFPLVEAILEVAEESGFRSLRAEKRLTSARRILPNSRDPRTGRFSSGTAIAIDEQVIFGLAP
jgi:hypothetical protein